MTVQTYRSDIPSSKTRLVVDTESQSDHVNVYTTGTTSALIDATQVEAIVKQLVGWLAVRAIQVSPMD